MATEWQLPSQVLRCVEELAHYGSEHVEYSFVVDRSALLDALIVLFDNLWERATHIGPLEGAAPPAEEI